MFRSFLSWRYLMRRRTNLIGVAGIFVAVFALIVIRSIMTGFLDQSRESVRGNLSDVVVAPIQAERDDGRTVPDDAERILEVVRADPRVTAATPRLNHGAVVSLTGDRAVYDRYIKGDARLLDLALVRLIGIDAGTAEEREQLRATDFFETLAADTAVGSKVADPEDPFAQPPGYRPDGRTNLDAVIVGEKLFEHLRLRRGDEIELVTAVPDPTSGEVVSSNRRFVVAGSFRTAENEFDLDTVYVDRDALADFLGRTRLFSEVLVRLEDYERDSEAVVADLRRELDERGLILDAKSGEVQTWEQFRGPLLGAIQNERVLMMVMLSLVLLVAAFTIFAILSMMVTEKRRDIGILTAVGATPRGIRQTFRMIAVWDAIVGSLFGTIAGVWAAKEINAIEQWLSGSFSRLLSAISGKDVRVQIFDRTVYIFDYIPTRVEPDWIAGMLFGTFVCAVIASALPAWRASRLSPLDALRYE